jgi:hypothetical protein
VRALDAAHWRGDLVDVEYYAKRVGRTRALNTEAVAVYLEDRPAEPARGTEP